MAHMTLQVGIEHVKDGFDCQLAAEKSLKSVRRAFPVLAPGIQKAMSQMDEVKLTLNALEQEIKALPVQEAEK